MSDEIARNSNEKDAVTSRLPLAIKSIAERFSLQLIFSLPFMVQFLIAVSLIAFVLFRGGQEAVNSVLKEMRQEVLERVHEQLSRHMKEPSRLNRLNADAWEAGLLNLSEPIVRERYFVNHIEAFPDVAMTFVGLSDGTFYGARRKISGEIQIVRNNKETGGDSWYYSISEQGDAQERQEVFKRFDPRTRPWYQTAQLVREPTFSGVYRHFVFLEPTITAAHPIFDAQGKIIGVFGVDYLLSWLGDMLRGIPVGASGQVFVTDADGFIVATSALKDPFEERNGKIERIRATESTNPILQMAARSLFVDGQNISQEVSLDGHSYLIDTRLFQENGINWRIYVVLASEDFLGKMEEAVHRTAVIAILAVIIAFFVTIFMSGWVTRPILRLNAAARELAEGRLQLVSDTERKDELGQLTRSFNNMARQLMDLVTNLEFKVAERTKELAEKTDEAENVRKMLYAELEKAGLEQRAMLPIGIDNSSLRLKILYEPCMLVSGDFCSYLWMKEETVLFGYLIDVSGHGVSTALQTAAMNVMIQETLHSNLSLSERMTELNHRVAGYFRDDLLVAALCFELDLDQGELRYVTAGITEFFADSKTAKGRIKTPGLFLGVTEELEFEEYSLPFVQGDHFSFYSDGIADRLNEGSEIPLGTTFEELVEAMNHIGAEGVRHDDVTVICIEVGVVKPTAV
ncbi:SpoIIE family protein phosphatase [Pelosinus sp. sgz500959]|uniref:SpoIIE family protein phosphatase n=1 Tax=Pelosinus sp. sgz500959 TaxID=3242472 RepID=UPI00367068FA